MSPCRDGRSTPGSLLRERRRYVGGQMDGEMKYFINFYPVEEQVKLRYHVWSLYTLGQRHNI